MGLENPVQRRRQHGRTYLVNLHVISVKEHRRDVVGAKRAALIHPPALAAGTGLSQVRKLHHLSYKRSWSRPPIFGAKNKDETQLACCIVGGYN